jgi:hypothetical protein
MVTFRLHRKGVVLVALAAVLVGALLFAAGCLTGLRLEAGGSESARNGAHVPPTR